jgi:hypothetical protein
MGFADLQIPADGQKQSWFWLAIFKGNDGKETA